MTLPKQFGQAVAFRAIEPPYLSVVIPVRCERKGLSLLLPDLMNQDYPKERWEIIVADGGSTDGTVEFVEDFALSAEVQIRVVNNRGIRSSAGRNAGISVARGEYIVFIDGHCRVQSASLLSDTVLLFQNTDADCLCRPQPLEGVPGSTMSQNIAEVRRSTFGHGRGSMIYNMEFSGFTDPRSSGASYRRSVFDKIGLYDENFDACEDVELNTRIKLCGMLAYTDPRLAIAYDARKTLSELAKQMMRYGRGRVRLATKHSEERSLSSLAPLLLCLSLVGPFISWHSPILFFTMSLPIVLYIFAMTAATIQLILRTRRIQAAWAFAIYPIIHFGLGAGMLKEALVSLMRNLPVPALKRTRSA